MKLTVETDDYYILKVPHQTTSRIVIHDYDAEDNMEFQEMYNLLESLGSMDHGIDDLSKWYEENVKKKAY